MENNNFDNTYNNVVQINETDSIRKFLANVFIWMFAALGISTLFAYIFAQNDLWKVMVDTNSNSISGFGLFVMFSPLLFVLIMRFGMDKIAFPILAVLFVAFSATMGIWLSTILLVYTASSVIGVFLTTSIVFGIMAIAGYTTKMDLTKFGSILYMFLIGMIVATVINWWLHSEGLSLIVTYIGVVVFVGLTAYKVQMLKNLGAGLTPDDPAASKLALWGGMSLYITFINLFLTLLRLFGRRR
ncbi:MAG: Bax inhibitor-1/YccA family protein [Sphingobacteriales bacterium]